MDGGRRALTILGGPVQTGAYILQIRSAEPLALAFGRFRGGERVALAAGIYLYVGSAMGRTGSSTLARRLARHATRSGNRPAHPLRAEILATFAANGLGSTDLRPPREKRLFWHVDYLLDSLAVTLSRILVLRAQVRLEEALADLLANRPDISLPARGLGASDTRRATHLFQVRPVVGWWEALAREAKALLVDSA